MKARFAVLAMLVVGLAFSGGGVGLAVSGLGGQGETSAQAQYVDRPGNGQGVLGEDDSGGNGVGDGQGVLGEDDSSGSGQDVLGEDESGSNDDDEAGAGGNGGSDASADLVQADRQVSVESGSTTSELPFTGLAAIPVIALGLCLLLGGIMVRRRTA